MPVYPPNIVQHNLNRSNQTIATLRPETSKKMGAFLMDVFNELGVIMLFYSGARNLDEQWEKRQKFLAGGPLAAKPGESWHNYFRAVDGVPIDITGKAVWDSLYYPKIAKIANRHGIKWGGVFGDTPHYYDDSGTSLAALKRDNPGWRKYARLEKQTGIIPVNDVDPVGADNTVIIKKVVRYGALLGLTSYIGYTIYRYVTR